MAAVMKHVPDRELVGQYVHLLDENGQAQRQGLITKVAGGIVHIEVFSWLDGKPVGSIGVVKDVVVDPKRAVLFENAAAMRDAYLQAQGFIGRSRY